MQIVKRLSHFTDTILADPEMAPGGQQSSKVLNLLPAVNKTAEIG